MSRTTDGVCKNIICFYMYNQTISTERLCRLTACMAFDNLKLMECY